MNGLMILWVQLGLPVATGLNLKGKPRIVSGAFSKNGVAKNMVKLTYCKQFSTELSQEPRWEKKTK